MNPKDYFISGKDHKDRKTFYKVIDKGFDFLNGKIRSGKVLQYKSTDFFKKKISQALPVQPKSITSVIDELDFIGKYSISQSDLNYLAFPDSGNSKAGLIGEIYTKFLNQNLIAFDRSAPIATFIEIQLIEWFRQLIGYSHKPLENINSLSEVSGMWTTGGHMSNHIALLTALNHKYPEIKGKGLGSLSSSPKIILAGKISHYSFSSAMHHLGLGSDNILIADSENDFTTKIDSLEKILKQHANQNDIFMVVGVAGNSRTSSIDDFTKLSKLCRKYKIWLHADACHGGSLLFSQKLKHRDLRGIEKADSVSLDPHKGMFVTYPCSYVIFKKRDSLVKFTRYEEKVRNGGAWDLGYINPFFGSKGFESLKMWLLIKHLGLNNLAKVVEDRDKMARYAEKLIINTEMFVLFHDMTFYRQVFIYYPAKIKSIIEKQSLSIEILQEIKKCVDFYTHKINQELYEEGNLCLDEFKLHDINNKTGLKSEEDRYYVMSITIGNPLYTRKSLGKSLSHLFEKGQKYYQDFSNEINKILETKKYAKRININFGPAGWT